MNSLSTQHGLKAIGLSSFGRFTAVIAASLVLLAMAGCAMVKPRTAEETVLERSQARWDALVKSDVRAAYGFLSPGSRSVMTSEAYATTIRLGFWKSAKVDKVVCAAPDSCEAHVTIEYEFRGTRLKTPLLESWIKEGSDWWYVQK